MRKRIVGVLLVLLIVLALVGARWRRAHGQAAQAAASPASSAAGVDFALQPISGVFDAPQGATPCETAYNAVSAVDQASRARNRTTPWDVLPDRDTFLARCAALPPQEQQCYQPRYSAENHPTCDPIFKKYAKNNPLWGNASTP
jgi:hypothetical protein